MKSEKPLLLELLRSWTYPTASLPVSEGHTILRALAVYYLGKVGPSPHTSQVHVAWEQLKTHVS